MTSGALPTFLVIGAAKSGTTSLHHYLAEHPEIWMSRTKELSFFQDEGDLGVYEAALDPLLAAELSEPRNWSRGLDWYRAQFDPRFAVRGESSPGYTAPHFRGVPERVASVVPDAKLVYCVRDPVERALSTWRFRRAGGVERRPVEEALQPRSYYSEMSCYAARLAPYLERFPRDRLHIVEAERLDAHRDEALSEVFAFLGVDPDFRTPGFDRRWNETTTHRGLRWRAISRLRAQPWWEHVATRVPRRALWLAQRVTTSGPLADSKPAPSPALSPAFLDELREDAERFRALCGRDLSHWRV